MSEDGRSPAEGEQREPLKESILEDHTRLGPKDTFRFGCYPGISCFNNDCPYYKRGWEWMKEQYNQDASYRYALNPNNGASLMIPVWDDEATRKMIVDDSGGGCG